MNTDYPFCEVCGRTTDHIGEHEDLLAAGLIDENAEDWLGLVSWRDGVTAEDIARFDAKA